MNTPAPNPALRRSRLALGAFFLLAVVLVASRMLTDLGVDLLWFSSEGYLPVFTRTLGWVWGVRVAVGIVVALLFVLNLRPVAHTLDSVRIRRRFGNLEISERLPRRVIAGGVVLVSLLLGVWFGVSVPESVGRQLLLWVNRVEWGVVDPFVGRDLSFYVFTLPVLRSAVTFALIAAFLVFTVVLAGYAATGALRLGQEGIGIGAGARRHLGAITAIFLLLVAARYALGQPLLLFFGSSDVQGIFGYTDAQARLPALRIQAGLAILAAIGVAFGAQRARFLPVAAGIGGLIVGSLLAGQMWPALVQRLQVQPNELERESDYIQENIRFTRLGFGVHELERSRVDALADGPVDWGMGAAQFVGLPVWTQSTLRTTFNEVDARFQYYDFPIVEFDRYPDGEGERLVALAVREVDPTGVEDPNWQNLHVVERYVVGNGVVASDLTARTDQGRPRMLVDGIPAVAAEGSPVTLERQSIFVGSRSLPYAVINATDSSYTAPDGSPGTPGVDFPDGIAAGGLFRKALLAWSLRDANILLAGEVGPESRLVLHRSVTDRVRRIAPFLAYPEAPWPVLHEGRVVWILEGYTATRFFPLSRAVELEFRRPVAYARNSVKITVDAVTGDVAFYATAVRDPLLEAWQQAFPELFRPLSAMPEGLRRHLRYPRSLIALQSAVLLQYHQEEPSVFFGQQDQWAVPRELAQSSTPVSYRAEYGIVQMPDDDAPRFQISTVFVPAGRQNLTGILAGRLAEDGTPELRLFDLPVEEQVSGPSQVEALIEQDPAISQQFSLWRTGGSRVWTGHLHTIPVGDRVIYMEPIFLAAEEGAIPELRRFVVSDGRRVAMAEGLSEAIRALAGDEVPARSGAAGTDPAGAPSAAGDLSIGALPAGALPTEALRLLDRAEERLRSGDWAGFGEALEALRRLLAGASGTG
ncbi:MAG: UPF0182 family protein [Longimicrobiales bacterium]|nr:UPF0182 family protein [Longimicrobiales bacterium]